MSTTPRTTHGVDDSARFRGYGPLISRYLEDLGTDPSDFPVNEIEAVMRLQYGTLDNLYPDQFRAEVAIGAEFVAEYPDEARGLAESMGL